MFQKVVCLGNYCSRSRQLVRERVTTRSKIIGMISFVQEKFVQNTVRIVENVREDIVVHVSSQLRRHGIVGGVQTKPGCSTRYRGRARTVHAYCLLETTVSTIQNG